MTTETDGSHTLHRECWVRRRFERLERQKRSIVSGVVRLSAAQLRFRPAPAASSVLDVLDHSIRVERALLEAVREQLPNGAPLTFRDRVRAWLLIAIMLTPIRVKVAASASIEGGRFRIHSMARRNTGSPRGYRELE